MKAITQNPYRVLGMYANDSLRVMTANIARIRAYLKVNKPITFKTDFVETFGPIDRSERAVETAISKLANQDETLLWKLFWIHQTDCSVEDRIDTSTPSIAGAINAAVLKLQKEDGENSVLNIGSIFEYSRTVKNLWETESFWRSEEECKRIAEKYTKILISEFGKQGDSLQERSGWFWWVRSALEPSNFFRQSIEIEYKSRAVVFIKDVIDGKISVVPHFSKEHKLLWLASPSISILNTFRDNGSSDGLISADIQLVYDQLALHLLEFCQKIFETNNTVLAEPVLEMADFVRCRISEFAYGQETKDKLTRLHRLLIQESEHLAPKEVEKSALTIQDNIKKFCAKDDTVRWALTLVRANASALKEIKSSLGSDHPCLEYLCTRVADNAVYSADIELGSAKRKYNNRANDKELALENLKTVITRCIQLVADIQELTLSKVFIMTKLNPFSEKCRVVVEEFGFEVDTIKANISLKDDNDKFAECGSDYQKLREFVLVNPESPLLQEAMKRIWEIEDDEFPSSPCAKTLLEYKQKFPNSHNDQRILNQLNAILLGTKNGSLMEYKRMLRLWPDHPKKAVIEGRIDLINFKNCVCVGDWEDYLKSFPNGQHRGEAQRKIEEEKFKHCTTIDDYNRFILNYPASAYFDAACLKIEEIVYALAVKSGDYYAYIKQYPLGKYAMEAHAQIEYALYQKVLANTKFSEYYKAYPNGIYTNKIKDVEETFIFNACKTPVQFKAYLATYPKGKFSDIARMVLKRRQRKALGIALVIFGLIGIIIFAISLYTSKSSDSTESKEIPSASFVQTANSTQPPYEDMASSDLYSSQEETEEPDAYQEPEIDYSNNRLYTGARPYRSYYGGSKTGGNEFSFKTASGSDYIVMIKMHANNSYIDHKYIRGGETATIKVPDGTYDVYFYSGNGWDPKKSVGNCIGGFVSDELIQKDGPITMSTTYEGDYYYNQTCSYTLYPVYNGNLSLQRASKEEAF